MDVQQQHRHQHQHQHQQQPAESSSPQPQHPAAKIDLSLLIDQLQLIVSNPSSAISAAGASDAQRHQLQQLTRAASVALEEPFETVQRLVYSPLPLITARIGQEFNIYSTIVAAKAPVSFAVLQDVSKLEPEFLESIMTYLSTQGMVQEDEPGRFTATKLSHLLTVPLFKDAITHFHDNCLPGFAALNSVLSHPASAQINAFKAGQRTDEDFYTWIESHPVQRGAFHRFMEAQFASLPTWLDVVDFEAELAHSLDETKAAFVDVGGGSGQQCVAFKEKLPLIKARIVLQDRPDVLAKALESEGMEKMEYDYLTEQPVKDARVYYFRQIFHNNNDETCIRILQSHAPAMGPDSIIIIDDKVLPDEKPRQGTPGVEYTAALSMAMKVMFDAQERREAHWRQLIDKAGFEIREIRKFTRFDDAVIMVVPKPN